MGIFGLYSNLSQEESLAALKNNQETRDNKQVSSDNLTDFVAVVLQNDIFEFDEKKNFKQK